MVAVLGMGGIGKRSVAAVFVSQVRESFTAIFWRSLQNAPPLRGILQDCIKFLSGQRQTDFPDDINQQITLLLEYFRMRRCLLWLYNVETVLQGGIDAGAYSDGYNYSKHLLL